MIWQQGQGIVLSSWQNTCNTLTDPCALDLPLDLMCFHMQSAARNVAIGNHKSIRSCDWETLSRISQALSMASKDGEREALETEAELW